MPTKHVATWTGVAVQRPTTCSSPAAPASDPTPSLEHSRLAQTFCASRQESCRFFRTWLRGLEGSAGEVEVLGHEAVHEGAALGVGVRPGQRPVGPEIATQVSDTSVRRSRRFAQAAYMASVKMMHVPGAAGIGTTEGCSSCERSRSKGTARLDLWPGRWRSGGERGSGGGRGRAHSRGCIRSRRPCSG